MRNYTEMKEHNKNVLETYIRITDAAQKSANTGEFYNYLEKLEAELNTEETPLKYDKSWFYLGIIGSIIIALAVSSLSNSSLGFILVPIAWFALRVKTFKSNNLRESLIDLAVRSKYNFDLNLLYNNQTPDSLIENFRDFYQKGNYANEVDLAISGILEMEEYKIPYSLVRYHYVNVRRDKNNKPIYSHYYDYHGILYEVDYNVFSVEKHQKRSRYPIKYKTSDAKFNRNYLIRGTDEMHLAKVFQPRFLNRLKDLYDSSLGVDFIHSHDRLPMILFDFNAKDLTGISHTSLKENRISSIKSFTESVTMPDYDRFLSNAELLTMFYKVRRSAI